MQKHRKLRVENGSSNGLSCKTIVHLEDLEQPTLFSIQNRTHVFKLFQKVLT